MARKGSLETELTRLKEKVKARRVEVEKPERDPALRSLHKWLKRAQRKRRSDAMRKQHAMGKAGAEAPKA